MKDNLFNLEKHRENPFLSQMVDEVRSSTIVKLQGGKSTDKKGVAGLVDTNSGEIVEATFLRKKEVDAEQFVKIFCNHVGLWADLSKPALKVFSWIINNLRPQADYVLINREIILSEIGYKSSETLYKGLRELVKAGIIAKGLVDGMWFINPLVVFNGDRVTFTTNYIKKKHPEVSNARSLHTAMRRIENIKINEINNKYPTMDEALFPDGENPIK